MKIDMKKQYTYDGENENNDNDDKIYKNASEMLDKLNLKIAKKSFDLNLIENKIVDMRNSLAILEKITMILF